MPEMHQQRTRRQMMKAQPACRLYGSPLTKCHRGILALFLTCVGLLMPVQTQAHEVTETLVLSNGTLPPVTTPAGHGYLDRLYAEWFSRAGLHAKLLAVPAARGLENANAGIYDGDAARTEIDSSLYPHLRRVPEPLSRIYLHGFHIDPDVSVTTADDFRQYRIGYVRGWRVVERLFEGVDNAVALRDADGLMDMLAAGRLDIAFLTLVPSRQLAHERNLGSLKETEFSIQRDQYLYLNAKHLDKIPRLTEALRLMKSDGSYDAIMADYFAENE